MKTETLDFIRNAVQQAEPADLSTAVMRAEAVEQLRVYSEQYSTAPRDTPRYLVLSLMLVMLAACPLITMLIVVACTDYTMYDMQAFVPYYAGYIIATAFYSTATYMSLALRRALRRSERRRVDLANSNARFEVKYYAALLASKYGGKPTDYYEQVLRDPYLLDTP